jgi:hypothetical protein
MLNGYTTAGMTLIITAEHLSSITYKNSAKHLSAKAFRSQNP